MRFAMFIGALLLSGPAAAEVHDSSPSGFVIRLAAEMPASSQQVWATLLSPRQWWNAEHSYSQDAANLSIDPRAGGCFCEVLPNAASPRAAPRGSVEHMRVIYIEEPRALRMAGALGPLQAGAGTGTLTIQLKPQGAQTLVLWEYVYGGYLRGDVPQLARAVDGVLAGQLLGLARALGASPDPKTSGPAPAPASASAPPPPPGREAERTDFLREMQEGIAQSDPASRGGRESQPEPTPPVKAANEQGFVGR